MLPFGTDRNLPIAMIPNGEMRLQGDASGGHIATVNIQQFWGISQIHAAVSRIAWGKRETLGFLGTS